MYHFVFRQMGKKDVFVYIKEMYDILASNMSKIVPTGNSYDEDYKTWSECVVPVFEKGKRSVILIFDKDVLCGYFQYCVTDMTFRMDEIQFRQEYQGSGLFSQLYHYLTTIIPVQTKYVEAYVHKANLNSQGILKHLGLKENGESKNGNNLYFKGNYKILLERYSIESKPDFTGGRMKIAFVESDSIKIMLSDDQWKQLSSLKRISEALAQDNVIGLDIYDSTKLVGFAMLRKYSDYGWFLWDYAIDQKYQNKRYGQICLQKLINYMITTYKAREISTTYLWGNSHARYVYEKVGFTQTDVVDEEGCHEVNMIYMISTDVTAD